MNYAVTICHALLKKVFVNFSFLAALGEFALLQALSVHPPKYGIVLQNFETDMQ